MLKGRMILTAVLALAAAGARAATTPVAIVDTDFTLQDPTKTPFDWQTNGNAGLQIDPTSSIPISLALAHNANSEAASAWTLISGTVPSFTMSADVRITHDDATDTNCPADGFTMAFATAPANEVGPGGGGLGLFGDPKIPSLIAFEVNLWPDNAIKAEDTDGCKTGKNVTFAFSDANKTTGTARDASKKGTADKGGNFLAQTTAAAGLQIVNGGWYHYVWNVDTVAGTMSAYITGLQDSNKAVQNMKLTSVTLGATAPKINFVGRWGLTAGTGGAHSGVNVAHVQVVTPAVGP